MGNLKKFISRTLRHITSSQKQLIDVPHHAVLETIDIMAITLDIQGEITFCNSFFSSVTGYTSKEIIGSNWVDRIGQSAITKTKKDFVSDLKHGEIEKHLETSFITKKGETRYFSWNNTVLHNSNGQIVGMTCIGEDITRLKVAEDALRGEQSKLAKISETVPGVLCSLRIRPDGSTHVPYASAASKDINGFEPEDLIDDSSMLLSLIHPDDLESVNESVAESAKNLTIWRKEFRYMHPEKGEIWIEGHSMPEREANGSTIWHGLLTDITERKQAEEELKQTHHELKNLYDHLDEAIFSFNTVQNKMLQVSAAHENVFGYPPSEFYKNPQLWYELIVPEDKPIADKGFPVLASGKSHQHQVRIKHPDGKIRWIEAKIKPTLNNKGELIQVDGIVSDITNRKNIEEEIERNEQMLRLFIKHSPASIAMFDRQMKYMVTSDRYLTDYDISGQDVVGRSHYEIFPEIPDRWKKIHKQCLVGKIAKADEDPFLRISGKLDWIRWEIHPWYERQDLIGGIILFSEVITDRKLANEKLRASENLNKALIKHLPHKIFIKDDKSFFITCNDNFAKDLGITPEAIVGKNDFDFFPEDISNAYRADDLEVISKGKIKTIEEKYIQQGEEKWVKTIKVPYRDANNNIVGVMGIFEDITEYKLAEIRLKESEEKYRTIFENVQDVFYQTDLKGILLDVSPSINHFTEFSRDEIVGTHVEELYYSLNDRNLILKEIWKKGIIRDYELKLKTKTGTIKEVSINARIITDSDGNPNHIDGAIRDITEKKQAEKQISLLSRAIDQSPVIVVITNKKGIIEYVNPKFTEVTGYPLSEVIGKNPRILQSGEHTEEFYISLWNTILSGNDWHGELHNKKKNGELYWENAVISSIRNNQGNISFFVAVKEDITEKKKMVEELISAKEKAEESDRLKTSFLHNISHEIRTPLNAIVGFTELLSDPDLPSETRIHYNETIGNSSDQLLSIINDIVNIATIESGQEKIVKKEIKLFSILELLHQQFFLKAKKQNVRLGLKSLSSESELIILSDEIKLIQILTNLISNALKFTTQGYVNFGFLVKENELEFFVEDSGIGIPTNMHDEIFRRFRQVENTATRQFGGSGLGLSISKAYVELLGGKMWLTSELNKGSTFYFTIPYKNTQSN